MAFMIVAMVLITAMQRLHRRHFPRHGLARVIITAPATWILVVTGLWVMAFADDPPREVRAELPPVRVIAGKPAANAGILDGDRIMQVNGTPVTSMETLGGVFASLAGTAVPIDIERNGVLQRVSVQVGDDGKVGIAWDPVLGEPMSAGQWLPRALIAPWSVGAKLIANTFESLGPTTHVVSGPVAVLSRQVSAVDYVRTLIAIPMPALVVMVLFQLGRAKYRREL